MPTTWTRHSEPRITDARSMCYARTDHVAVAGRAQLIVFNIATLGEIVVDGASSALGPQEEFGAVCATTGFLWALSEESLYKFTNVDSPVLSATFDIEGAGFPRWLVTLDAEDDVILAPLDRDGLQVITNGVQVATLPGVLDDLSVVAYDSATGVIYCFDRSAAVGAVVVYESEDDSLYKANEFETAHKAPVSAYVADDQLFVACTDDVSVYDISVVLEPEFVESTAYDEGLTSVLRDGDDDEFEITTEQPDTFDPETHFPLPILLGLEVAAGMKVYLASRTGQLIVAEG